jgi:hypothetical protein
MNTRIKILIPLLLTILFWSFADKSKIGNCFISFAKLNNLTAAEAERLPETSEKVRKIKTDHGEVEITRIDGYRVLYNNDKNAAFVNLKIELSQKESYTSDQKGLVDNLKYLISRSPGMEKNLIELEFNGYKVYGISREKIESTNSTLGIFVMFPGNNVTVYFYFNNLKPEISNFDDVDDYRKQRDTFMDKYTKHLSTCKEK